MNNNLLLLAIYASDLARFIKGTQGEHRPSGPGKEFAPNVDQRCWPSVARDDAPYIHGDIFATQT
jgi:hypothetical protein